MASTNKLNLSFSFSVLLSAMATLTITGEATAKTFYMAKVKKHSVNEFFSRMATDTHHIVVTDQKPKEAIEIYELEANSTADLGVFELEPQQKKPDEAQCFGRICMAPVSVGFHGDHFHFQSIDSKKTKTLTPKPIELMTGDSFVSSQNLLTVKAQDLKKMLGQLTGEENVVVDGQTIRLGERNSLEGRNNARKYLAQEYRKLGYSVHTEKINSRFRQGANLIAEKRGTNPDKIFIVSAHMDTMRTAGADDNGSGTISALAIAKALKDFQPKYTLRFVAFDLEEGGLVGARDYARNMDRRGEMAGLMGLINLEMTAYDSDNDGAYHVIDCGENASPQLTQAVETAVHDNGIKLVKKRACTNRSDHAIFWRYNRPAVVVSQNYFSGDPNPCYHRRCDTTSRLNFNYMANITSSVATAVHSLLQ